MISPGSASFTRNAAISANCWLNCAVKLAGMCCTSRTAPGKSLGNDGMNFISVAGPPVDAATMTNGNLPLARLVAAGEENAEAGLCELVAGAVAGGASGNGLAYPEGRPASTRGADDAIS